MRRADADEFVHLPRRLSSPASTGSATRLLMLDAGCAAALFICGGGAMHYHLSGSTAEGRRDAATNLLLCEAMGHARERGLQTLHLGGGLRAGDALATFKQSVGAGRAAYVQGRAVHDPDAYRALCQEAGVPRAGRVLPRLPCGLMRRMHAGEAGVNRQRPPADRQPQVPGVAEPGTPQPPPPSTPHRRGGNRCRRNDCIKGSDPFYSHQRSACPRCQGSQSLAPPAATAEYSQPPRAGTAKVTLTGAGDGGRSAAPPGRAPGRRAGGRTATP